MVRAKDTKLAYISEQDGSAVIGKMVELYGTSSDTKPTEGIVNGSTFQEVDTGDFYFFNETTSTWVKKNESGGGGGDFSVANVEYLAGPEIIVPTMIGTPAEAYPACSIATPLYGGTAPAMPVILYKGTCAIDTPFSTLDGIVLTGDAEAVYNSDTGEYIILVHGDCTIAYHD